MKVLCLFVLLFAVKAQNFCEFFCVCGFDTATCVGVSVFPIFESTVWIKTLNIYQSNLKTIPVLSQYDFPAMTDIYFENCPNLSCETINILQKQRPSLSIHMDTCFEKTTSSVETGNITTYATFTTEKSFESTQNSMETSRPITEKNSSKNKNDYTGVIAITISCISLAFIALILGILYYVKKRQLRNRVQSFHLDLFEGISNETAI